MLDLIRQVSFFVLKKQKGVNMALKTDYKDDVLDTSKNMNRKYVMTNNADSTVSLTDVTSYATEGDVFGAGDINETNAQVNANTNALNTLSFGKTSDGKWGYKVGASTEIIPFKTSTSLSVNAEGGKRWCRTTILVKEGTITYGGVVYTAGQSIVIQAQNPTTVQEDIPVSTGYKDMIASN